MAGLISRLRAAMRPKNLGQIPTSGLTSEELSQILGLSQITAAGVSVTPELAMRVSTVYACVSIIAGAIASLPVALYERGPGGIKRRADADGTGKLWWLFNEQSNEEMTSFDVMLYAISSKLLYGDGYIQLRRAGPKGTGPVQSLYPHHPGRVWPMRDTATGEKLYRVQPPLGAAYTVPDIDMLHLGSLGYDAVVMRSPSVITAAAREAVGSAVAAEAYMAKLFSEGATFDYALKTAGNISKEQIDSLKASLASRAAGSSRAPLILTGGLEPAQLSVNPRDAEILASRSFSVEDIARFFGVPPHMVGHQEKSTSFGTGIEQQGIAFARYTLMRHIQPLAQEINRKVWPVRERWFAEFDLSALERTDMAGRYNAYRVAIGRAGEPGWMTQNEIRARENMPPVADGDDINQGGQATAQGNQNEPLPAPTA